MKKIAFALLCVLILINCTAFSEQNNPEEYSITLDKSTITVKNGESVTVTVHVNAPEGASYSIGGSYENKYVCSASLGTKNGNDTSLVITGTGYGVSTVSVYVNGHPETEKVITVNVTMSNEEWAKTKKVQYISDRSFFFYDNEDVFVLMFSFKDKDEKRIDAPAKVDIRIENDDGVVVYEKTKYVNMHDFGTWTSAFYGERYLAAVYISPEDIMESSSSDGNVYFTVTTGDYYFDESKVSVSELPKADLTKQCSLDMPSLPRDLTYSSSSGKVYSKVNVTQMTYEFKENYDGTMCLTLYFSGQKTYDYKGDGNSSACRIGWKLYDEEGYVIKTGTCYTSALETGEKFKNEEDSIYNLEPGHYSIKLINVE